MNKIYFFVVPNGEIGFNKPKHNSSEKEIIEAGKKAWIDWTEDKYESVETQERRKQRELINISCFSNITGKTTVMHEF